MPTSRTLQRKARPAGTLKRKRKVFPGAGIEFTVEFDTSPYDSMGTDWGYIVKARLVGFPADTAIPVSSTKVLINDDELESDRQAAQHCLQNFVRALNRCMEDT